MSMKNVCPVLKSLNFNTTLRRTLFHESYIGLDRYKKRRAKESQSLIHDESLKRFCQNPQLKILSNQLKRYVYLVNTEEDFKLFSDVLHRYAMEESNSESGIRFQVFNIGPEILRVYYAMNKPAEAYSLIKNPQTFAIICNLTALVILQDLLYENGFYEEVCEVFDIIQEKQFYKRTFHYAPYVLYQAACYKMDTPQSYNNVISMFQKYIKFNSRPKWPSLMYTLMLALKNGSLDIPVKYTVASDSVSVNIKLSALIKSGNYSDALDYWNDLESKSIIAKSVAEDLSKSLENFQTLQNKTVLDKLEKLKQEIGQTNFIDKTLDELAQEVMHSQQK